MVDNPELNLEGIPEAQREAVTNLVNTAVSAAVGVVAEKSESDFTAYKSAADKRYGELEVTSRDYQRTIAGMKDESTGAGASELGKSVADLEQGWKSESDAKALQDAKDETASLQTRLNASELATAKTAALTAGVPEALVTQAKSASELNMAVTIHETYGGETPKEGGGNGRLTGSPSPTSTMTPSGDKPTIDTSTHAGEMLHSQNELANAGMDMSVGQ